jgi:branched-chain amino acid transport system ATP-binding protein
MLEVEDLHAYYGKSHILQGVSLRVGRGEIVGLLGRNGAGRSTTIKAIMGEVAPAGAIRFKGERIDGLKSHEIARRGLGYVPEDRDIFPTLTVRDNLLLGMKRAKQSGRWSIGDMYALFPNLKERLRSQGTKLSGGEQQMLAIGRILRTGARLLLLDEPTEGLAPVIVQQIGRTIAKLKAQGFTILLVEQNFRFAATVADRHYVMDHGRVVDMIPNADLQANMAKLHDYLGV